MNKDELEKEAEGWLNKWELCNKCENKVNCISNFSYCKKVVLQSYLASAEPREKKIKTLGKRCLQLQKDKGELTDKIKELQNGNFVLTVNEIIEGKDKKIAKLEAQIEKMKCCENCGWFYLQQHWRENKEINESRMFHCGTCRNKRNWKIREIKEK